MTVLGLTACADLPEADVEELEVALKPEPAGSKGGPKPKPVKPAPQPDPEPEPDPEPQPEPTPDPAPVGAEVVVTAQSGERVVFTAGAHTVRFEGPARTFSESKHGITNTVLTSAWVHLLPSPFDGLVDASEIAWLEARVAANVAGVPDVLAMAHQYIDGSPDRYEGALRIAGDAGYGETTGADFNDFLGIDWSYPEENRNDPYDLVDLGNLDCSGYVRIVYGYRGGIPMSWGSRGGTTLPRTSANQLTGGTGVITIPNLGEVVPASELARLEPGDLVFFDASGADGTIDHVGIFLGIDTAGNHRMLNSRNSMFGPTMRDGGGSKVGESGSPSILNGTMLYGRSLRAARRL